MLKNNKNKTNTQWFLEWLGTLIFLILLAGGIFISRDLSSELLRFLSLSILSLITFIVFFIFLARTGGLVMTLFFPGKKSNTIHIQKENITIPCKDGTTDTYPWNTIERIILSEEFDGIYIHSASKKQSYEAPIHYKDLERAIDAVLAKDPNIVLKKKVQWIESNQAGLDPHKDPTGVQRTYESRKRLRTIDSEHGIETIYYSR